MDIYVYLSGILIWPIYFIISNRLFKKARMNPQKITYSDLGSNRRFGWQYNILLVTVAIIQLVFLFKVSIFSIYSHPYIWLIITTVCGLLTGIITKRSHLYIHLSIAILGFVSSVFGWVGLGIYLYQSEVALSVVIFSLGAVMIPFGALYYIFTARRATANFERLMFIGALITNIGLIYLKFF